MINHVLVPLDGSQLAEKAIVAARQVVRAGGEITLLTAIHDPGLTTVVSPHVMPDETREDFSYVHGALSRAREYLERVARNLRLNGYHVSIEVAAGEPADAIIRQAEELRADMVIMSTHGRSGLSRFLFGSITLKVLEASVIPVLVIPNREREELPAADRDHEAGISPAT